VKSIPLVCAGAIAAALSGCSEANASGFDAANPLHCAAQFESYAVLARQQGDEQKARGFGARAQWYAKRARSLPAEQLTPAALNELGNQIVAAPDGGLALATECWNRLEADPEYQRFFHQK
jgi:hypothetical protein